eukprot:4028947-Amphidinium_carterae.1
MGKNGKASKKSAPQNWGCAQCTCADNWPSRVTCRGCGHHPKPASGKGGGQGGDAQKTPDSAELLLQVVQQQSRMQEALTKLTANKPSIPVKRDMEVDKEGDEEVEPDVAEKMRSLQQDIDKLKSVLGDQDPAVTSRVRQLEELAKKRPLASQLLYVQRKLRKLEKREQELQTCIREGEHELQQLTGKMAGNKTDLLKVTREKEELLSKQRSSGELLIKPQVAMPDALQIFAELAGQ